MRFVLLGLSLVTACADGAPPADTDAVDSDVVETDVVDTDLRDTGEDTDDTDLPDGPPRYTLTLLTSPDGLVHAQALGGATDGAVAGYAGDEEWSPTSRAVVVAAGGAALTELKAPKDGQAIAYDVRGEVAVGKASREPAVWVDGNRTTLKVPEGYFSGVARGIGTDGLLVGSYADEDDVWTEFGPRPCVWTAVDAAPTPLAVPSEDSEVGSAAVVSDAGVIGGTVWTDNGHRAVTWADVSAAPVEVGTPVDALLSEVAGIDEHGHVVGRVTYELAGPTYVSYGFTTAGGYDELDGLGDGWTEVYDIDERHVVVGTSRAPGPVMRATLWWGGVAYDLNDLVDDVDGVLTSAVAIDGVGRIVVQVETEEGEGIGVLVPE